MGCHILTGHAGNDEVEVFFCSTTDWAFGPVMPEGHGHLFMDWLAKAKGVSDPRRFTLPSDLEKLWHEFQGLVWECEDCGAPSTELIVDAEDPICQKCREGSAEKIITVLRRARDKKESARVKAIKKKVIDDHMKREG